LAAEAAVHGLLLLLREIESRLDAFRCPILGRGAWALPIRRLRQRSPGGAEHCESGDGNEMSHWVYSFLEARFDNAALPVVFADVTKRPRRVSKLL
jgi:hypothetical protein